MNAHGAQQQERHSACYKKLRGLKALCCGTEEDFDDHCSAGRVCCRWASYKPPSIPPPAHIEWAEYAASLQAALDSGGVCQGAAPLAVAPRCKTKLDSLQLLAGTGSTYPVSFKFNATERRAQLFQPGGDCDEDPTS